MWKMVKHILYSVVFIKFCVSIICYLLSLKISLCDRNLSIADIDADSDDNFLINGRTKMTPF